MTDPAEHLRVPSARVEAALTPVPGDSPVGAAANYDPEYDELRRELSKLETPSGVPVQWPRVAETASKLLTTRSKDLLLGVWLALAWADTDGLRGVADGLTLVAALMTRFGDAVFPVRARGRAAAATLFVNRVELALTGRKVSEADRSAVEAVRAGLDALLAAHRERLGDDAPIERPLKDAVRQLEAALPPPPPPPPPPRPVAAPATATTSPAAPTVTTTAVGVQPPRTAAAAPEFLGQLASAMLLTGNLLRSADRSDAMGYRLRRLARTLTVTQLPDDALGLPEGARQALKDMTDRAAWPEILDVGESAGDDFPYSLDLERTISRALGALGQETARDVVHAEAAALAHRFPALLTRTDADGNRHADDLTIAWLGAAASPGDGSEPVSSGEPTPVDPLAEVIHRARTLAGEEALLTALELLQQAARAAHDAPTRLRARLELTELCLFYGPPRLSLALTRDLVADLERHDLERWDPSLAARGLALAVRARNQALAAEYPLDLADELFARLARIDPAAALRSLQ